MVLFVLIWRNFGHLRPKFVHFFAKIDSFLEISSNLDSVRETNHTVSCWLKNGLLSQYLRNRALDFDDFSQMLDIIALNDLASVLCTKKNVVPSSGGAFLPPKMFKIPHDSDF